MSGSELEYSVKDFVGYLNLNRPEYHNAITRSMWTAIPLALNSLRTEGAKCIVITGSGESFSSGANLDELEELTDRASASQLWHSIRDALTAVADFELPVIACIRGACIGGGCLLACACDFRIASSRACFAVPTSKLGLLLDDLTVSRLVSLVGPAVSKFLLMTGQVISAERGSEFGLVSHVLEDEAVMELVGKVTAAIVQNDENAVISSKRSVNRISRSTPLSPADNDAEVVGAYLTDQFRARLKKLRQY